MRSELGVPVPESVGITLALSVDTLLDGDD
jgi:hypothetical protein